MANSQVNPKGRRQSLFMVLLLAVMMHGFFVPSLTGQTSVEVTIDARAPGKVISPNIYGKNNSLSDNPSSPVTAAAWQRYRDAGITIFRESGGNNSTKYNWRKKLSSHPDWYNNVYSHDWDYAARSLQQNLPAAQGMWTLSLLGWAASNKSNNFNDWNYNSSNWWSGVHQNLAGGGTVNPDGGSKALQAGDPTKYLEQWPADSVVEILRKWMGEGGLGYDPNRLLYWNMDNEPEIWSGTHDDVMTQQIPAEEFMQRYFETAKKARALFPDIKLMGPLAANEWQWYNWNNNAIASEGKNYVWLEYFIKRVAEEQKATGVRLLDLLDIHFYPGETDPAQVLQLHRVYFDRNYVYPGHNGVHRIGGWNTSINKEYVFERCREWLEKYMGPDHGVTFSVTETSVSGNLPVMVNTLWYASMLGEFGQRGVEVFTPWDWRVGMYEVVHLFTRYSHAHAIPGVSSDETLVSAYSSISEDSDSVTVILVNRHLTESRQVNVSLSNFVMAGTTLSTRQLKSLPATETFVSASENGLLAGTTEAGEAGFSVVLPPLTVTAVMVPGGLTAASALPQEPGKEPSVKLFPNPATTECRVVWSHSCRHEGTLEVRDIAGKLLFRRHLDASALEMGTTKIPVSHWQKGSYFVRLTTPEFSWSSPLMVW